jgi:hypothetical protein
MAEKKNHLENPNDGTEVNHLGNPNDCTERNHLENPDDGHRKTSPTAKKGKWPKRKNGYSITKRSKRKPKIKQNN